MLLQSGNTGTDTTTGEPVIYDPSSFYGHNEAEYVVERHLWHLMGLKLDIIASP